MKGKKIVSTLLALLLLASLPVSALAADWDIGSGDITVNAGSGGQTVTQGSQVDVPDSAPVIKGSSTKNTVTINAEKDQTANVTLSGANIDVSNEVKAAVSTTGEGNVSIELDGDSTLKSGFTHAGLEKNNGGSLTIADEDKNGKLTVEGGNYGAGIGGGYNGTGSDITISGGEVNATGGAYGAGIGGGWVGSGSDITISGGEVKATGGAFGAGIGGGWRRSGSDITISGGEIKATGGGNGAGIGGGWGGSGSDIAISGGEVNATGGNYGAGIGGGWGGSGSDLTISGGEVNATGGYAGAGIGGGCNSAGSDIAISGGEVNATGGQHGAGIGGGQNGSGNNIAISGGEVKATSGENGAGIGGGCFGDGNNITVSGDAKLKVQGGVEDNTDGAGAGIGNGGSKADGSPIPGAEVAPDTSDLTTGRIEYYAPGADMETDNPTRTTVGASSQPEKPTDPGAEHGADAPLYRVTDQDGKDIAHKAERKDGVLTITVDADLAILTGKLSSIDTLKRQGIEKIVFVTNKAASTFQAADLLEKGASSDEYRLTHDGTTVTFVVSEKETDVSGILIQP